MFPFLSLFRKVPLPLGRPTLRWMVARKFSYHNICLVKLNERLFQVSPCQTRPTTCVCVYCGVSMESGKSVCYHDFNEWELSFIDTSNFLFKSITSAHSFHTCFAFALSVHSLTGLSNFLSAMPKMSPHCWFDAVAWASEDAWRMVTNMACLVVFCSLHYKIGQQHRKCLLLWDITQLK